MLPRRATLHNTKQAVSSGQWGDLPPPPPPGVMTRFFFFIIFFFFFFIFLRSPPTPACPPAPPAPPLPYPCRGGHKRHWGGVADGAKSSKPVAAGAGPETLTRTLNPHPKP